MAITIYYDGECPFCSTYVSRLRLREAVGEVEMVDLREDADARRALRGRGMDPEEGMAVEYRGNWFHGADAVRKLALLSTPSDRFNRLAARVLGSERGSRWLYPLLRGLRRMVLWLLRRSRIGD